MLCITRNRVFNSFTLFIALLSTSLANPVQAYAKINEIKFAIQTEKIIEKLLRSKDKSPEKMIGYALDLKKQIEKSFNFKFFTKDYLDWTCDLLKQQTGQSLTKGQYEYFKKAFKVKDAYHNIFHGELDSYEIDFDESIINEMSKKVEADKDVPPALVWGVTLTLCGLFMMATRIPVCVEWGSKMVMTGISACAGSICTEIQNNKDKDKDQAENLPPPKKDNADWS